MAFFFIPRTLKYFIGLIIFMFAITFYNLPRKRILVSRDSNLWLQSSSKTKDAMLDSLNVSLLSFNVDEIQKVFKQMDNILRQEKETIVSFLSGPIINNHRFEYFHNPKSICTDSATEILIVVPSAPGNFERRKILRNGDYVQFLNITESRTKLLFFIGVTKDNTTQSRIDNESNTYKDIVQESFEDIYHNIRYKAVSMLRWTTTFCSNAKYVIRNDDDIVINLTSITTTLKRIGSKYSNFIIGRLRFNDRPTRAEKNKVYLLEREYPETFFPPYALGGLLGYPILTVELLYEAALRVKPIWLDDVYITGICGQKVGVKLLSDPRFEFKHKP